ncbi:unnamed protein product [Coregonus sp. 'balchen']|nr:unnamed protein product [Coregonus sp. 'balchen']
MDGCGEGSGTNRMMMEKLSLACDRLLSHLQLACCPSHCASPLQGKDLLIHSLLDPELKALRLTGHHGDISAMVFGTGRDPLLLCSASADYVIVWDIRLCYRRTREVIGTLLGKVVHLSFCPCDERVAACSGDKVYILNSKIEDVLSVLAGHLGPLTAAEFCPWNKDILVSISEDRTFKKSRQLVTGSADGQVGRTHPHTHTHTHTHTLSKSVISHWFQVWSFTLPEDHRCHLVTKLDLHKVQQRHQRHLDTVVPQTGGVIGITPDPVETAKPVLRICAYHRRLPDIDHGQQSDNSWVWMGSSDGLYLVDLGTSELQMTLLFRGILLPSLCVCVCVFVWKSAP